jgi:hypothetical protein
MPAKATVFRWLASYQEFRRSYALARECQAEDFAYEILVARQCLKIKALKWIMARMAPRKYGSQ